MPALRFYDWVPTLAATDFDPAKLLAIVDPLVQSEQGTIGDLFAAMATTYGIVKNNVAATDPTVNDDSTLGYSASSMWFNTLTGKVLIAYSVAVGAAVWAQLAYDDQPSYNANNWYTARHSQATSNSTTVNDTMYLIPFTAKTVFPLNAFGVRTGTAVATSAAKLGIYDQSGARPAARISYLTNPLATPGLNTNYSDTIITGPTDLPPGEYWLTALCSNAGVYNGINTSEQLLSEKIGSASITNAAGANNNSTGYSYSAAGLYAAGLPASLVGLGAIFTGTIPITYIQAR